MLAVQQSNLAPVSRVYDSDEGFTVVWDFAHSLPKYALEIQVAYALFEGGVSRTQPKAMPICLTEEDGSSFQKVVLQEKRVFTQVGIFLL